MLTIMRIRVYWVLFDESVDVMDDDHIYKSERYSDVTDMAYERELTLLPPAA